MSEVYTDNQSLADDLQPKPLDNSFEFETIVRCIGVRAKSYCRSSINKYLFSFGLNWLTIRPYRNSYAVVGRLFPRGLYCVKKSTVDYDYFSEPDSLDSCISVFYALVRLCLDNNYVLCVS